MHIDDFLLNFRQTYKSGKSEEGSKDQNEETLRREFEYYSPDKLDKIWQAVRRHHKATWYPIIGQVLECMDKAGVNESTREGKKEIFYNRCLECGCSYSLKARNCPDCNRPIKEGYVMNNVEIVKADVFSNSHITCNETCPICPTFKQNRNIRGSKCRGWSKDEHEKIGLKCDTCKCRFCCEEKAERNHDHKTGEFMDWVGQVAKHDPYWIKYYDNMDIAKGKIIKYAGYYYQNKTGNVCGQSPGKDSTNWEHYR